MNLEQRKKVQLLCFGRKCLISMIERQNVLPVNSYGYMSCYIHNMLITATYIQKQN